MLVSDPICALATPPGAAGLAIIRLSGAGAFAVADNCFRGKTLLREAASHTIHYGKLHNGGTVIDQVTAFVYRAPHSYTGEDTVEFGCHGSMVVAGEILETLIENGARAAEAGEFTKRAFLNGKLDLTEAEAVGDIIHAVSRQGAHAAARQLAGGFTRRLEAVREQLLQLCGLLELELDFSEEHIELISKDEIAVRLEVAQHLCLELAASHRSAEILRNGFGVGIVGYPNAGKSSLLNALVERTRAIVSPIAGTTRDYIEEVVQFHGAAVRLVDTAGFRASEDVIEVEGIRLAESLLEQCHLILVLNDIMLGNTHSHPLLERLQAQFPNSDCVLVQNKIDEVSESALIPAFSQREKEEEQAYFMKDYTDTLKPDALEPSPFGRGQGEGKVLAVSALTGTGIAELKRFISRKAHESTASVSDALINARQAALLYQASLALAKAHDAVVAGVSNEFAAIDLREALKRIGEITGAVWNDEVLNAVFAKFCIGK
jgi:tRNA modification GTPase